MKKKFSGILTAVVISAVLALVMFTGCATGNNENALEPSVKAETGNTDAGPAWIIEVVGVGKNTMSKTDLHESKEHGSHYVSKKIEKNGETHTYKGIPLRLLMAMVDGPDNEHPYVFDKSKWEAGYDITITASDGYSATFTSSDFDPETIIIADEADGQPIPPQIAGDIPGNLWVKDIALIEADLGDQTSDSEVFTLKVDIAGIKKEYSIPELEASPWYIEGTGSFTTSAGTTFTNMYGGIKFAEFVNSFTQIEPDTTITMVAMDGYEMTYSGSQILDKTEGEWIIAFKMDGEYMEFDPGYIRTVKIGPGNPNIDGHLSVKMIETIRATGEKFEDFNLLIKGKSEWTLDRQTMQSGVSCHSSSVTYYDRKADQDDTYTGIPLYLLLAYGDDPQYAPHHQDKSIISYNEKAAMDGYKIKISAADGFSITLDSSEIHKNNDVIIAMFKNGEPLPERERPLVIVWDKDASVVPEGIKAVRNIVSIELLF